LNIRFFFKRLYNILFSFSEEWKAILKEKGYAGIIFFTIYLSIFVTIAFFLGAMIYSGTKLGVQFILPHLLSVFVLNIFFTASYAFIFGKIMDYYCKNNVAKSTHKLVVYSFTSYFIGNIIGYLTTPENFFFISFIASFFAAYYFFQGIVTISKKINELFAFGMSSLFFVLLIVSYFLINNALTLLA